MEIKMKPKLFDKTTLQMLIIGVVLIAILLLVPTGYEGALIYQESQRAVVEVVAVDNSMIQTSGLIQFGEQTCTLLVKDGTFKGYEIQGVNFLSGSLAEDKI
jgi:hypothetical protein